MGQERKVQRSMPNT